MARIVYKSEDGQDKEVPVSKNGDQVLVGRVEQATIRFGDLSVSRKHCVISWRNNRFMVEDNNSANGTWINNQRISSPTPVSSGDEIKCGEMLLRFLDEKTDGPKLKVVRPESDQAPVTSERRATKPTENRTEPASEKPGWRDATRPAQRDASAKPSTDSAPSRSQQSAPAGMEQQMQELADLLRKAESERDELQKRAASGQKPRENDQVKQLKSVTGERDSLKTQLDETKAQLDELKTKLKESEERGTGYSVQLESVTKTFRQTREELDRSKARVEELREQLVQREDHIEDLQRKMDLLEDELKSVRGLSTDTDATMRDLKRRISEKDRQIDQLNDQITETEYELNEAREEIRQLQSDFNRDGGELTKLERMCNHLREVNEEKDNIVAQLRRDLEEKDREIKQIRMGVGLADLEEERRKVVEDFIRKSREVDRLSDEIATIRRERDEAAKSADEIKRKLDENDEYLLQKNEALKASEQKLKEVRRELAAETRDKDRIVAELEEVRTSMQEFPPESFHRLNNELQSTRRQLEQLQEKWTEARAQLAAATAQPVSDVSEIAKLKTDLRLQCDELRLGTDSLHANLSTLNMFVRDIQNAVQPLLKLRDKPMDPEIKQAMQDAQIESAVESFGAVFSVLEAETTMLEQQVTELITALED